MTPLQMVLVHRNSLSEAQEKSYVQLFDERGCCGMRSHFLKEEHSRTPLGLMLQQGPYNGRFVYYAPLRRKVLGFVMNMEHKGPSSQQTDLARHQQSQEQWNNCYSGMFTESDLDDTEDHRG